MEYTLMTTNGRVKYIMRQSSGTVGSDTPKSSAEWMLQNNGAFKSMEFEGYPIGVKTQKGDEYFFQGVWPEPKRKRKRVKDVVCE